MSEVMSQPYVVTIIMSTYNGDKYIKEQLDSLLVQEDVIINLLIRDDGSTDNTISVAELYRNKFNHFKIIKGTNVGATESFFYAAKFALYDEFKADFYAFCDQDDIWLPNKLITAIQKIYKKNMNSPVLFFSNLMMMNEKGELIGKLLDDTIVSCDKYNAMAAIYTYGCTCVFNGAALEKFCCLQEQRKIFHDNWLYAVCVFLGETIYDEYPYIYYRQTGKNVSGDKKSGMALWTQRVKKIFNPINDEHIYENIAINLIKYFQDEIDIDDRVLLEHILNYRKNFRDKLFLLLSKRMKTKKMSKNICIKGRILLNRL